MITFRASELTIRELPDGREYVGIKAGFDEDFINEMRKEGVNKVIKTEEGEIKREKGKKEEKEEEEEEED